MFNLFKKKTNAPASENDSFVLEIFGLYEELSRDFTEIYEEFDAYNPAELRFFVMSATSVFVQTLGNLPQTEMHVLIDKFTEQCVANMLFYMPKADYSRVHNGFLARFGDYSDLIIETHNAQTSEEIQHSTFALITEMDTNIGVDRDAIEKAIAGLTVYAMLTDFAIAVHNSLVR